MIQPDEAGRLGLSRVVSRDEGPCRLHHGSETVIW